MRHETRQESAHPRVLLMLWRQLLVTLLTVDKSIISAYRLAAVDAATMDSHIMHKGAFDYAPLAADSIAQAGTPSGDTDWPTRAGHRNSYDGHARGVGSRRDQHQSV